MGLLFNIYLTLTKTYNYGIIITIQELRLNKEKRRRIMVETKILKSKASKEKVS